MKKKLAILLCASAMLAVMPLTVGATEVGTEVMDATAQESEKNEESVEMNVPADEEVMEEVGISAEGEVGEKAEALEEASAENDDLVVPGLDAWEYFIDGHEIQLKKYIGSYERIRVPATYTINSVTYSVNVRDAFNHNKTIKEVKVDKGANMWSRSFVGCTSLEKAQLPEGVTDCNAMFYDCSSLTEAPSIPEGVTDCNAMFKGCSSLTEAPSIPEGVRDCSGMFQNCSNLTKAPDIPKGVRVMLEYK